MTGPSGSSGSSGARRLTGQQELLGAAGGPRPRHDRRDQHGPLGGAAEFLWVLVHTSAGVTGLGETYYLPGAVE